MTRLIRLLEAVWIVIHWAMLMPIFIIAYMFFCITKIISSIIVIGKVVLKIHRKIMNSFDNYLKDDK